MVKTRSAVFTILILGLLFMVPAYCADEMKDEDLRTFEGQVVSVDAVNLLVTVKGATAIVFPISDDTKLQKDIYDIKLSDIAVGNYVTVGYYEGDNGPSKVLSVTVKYE